ncbi:SRPBCC domain-containing protein [Patulibacter sp.]|uniref:SRPBCC family protein n=1 Tax=Patulibacter sp. TaxID=1912859 RepID=UPI002721E9AD|nr:SRPBCC domain-containing protein [Patulibacter sp.]MDO9409438.1 SRPBCC domain-containing protein [Patulibacter sp.]
MTDPPLLADHPDAPDVALVRVPAVVPGTPSDVWWAVATGAGLSTWFVPASVQARVGGAVVTDHGPFGHSHGTVTAYDEPHRFAYEEREWGTDVPPWRTEVVVEAVDEATCRVRLTSGLTVEGDRYRAAVAGTEEGWAAGLRNLVLAREHFPGQPAGGVFVVRSVSAGRDEAWTALLGALGLQDATMGDQIVGAAGAPLLAGTVEEVGPTNLLVRTTAPAPGLVELSVHTWQSTAILLQAHLFGPGGAMVAQAERPRWDMWLHARFPGARPT